MTLVPPTHWPIARPYANKASVVFLVLRWTTHHMGTLADNLPGKEPGLAGKIEGQLPSRAPTNCFLEK